MAPGLIGVLIPILPGVGYMFVIALLFGFVDQFQHLTGSELGWLGLLALISLGVDYVAGVIGAKYFGASQYAIRVGLVGMLLGTFLAPPFGALIGLGIGVYIGSSLQKKSKKEAVRAASGSIIGSTAGIAINLLLAILFLLLFIRFAN